MSALILKSGNTLREDTPDIAITAYVNRVKADGGKIYDMDDTLSAFSFVRSNMESGNVFSACSLRWGVKMAGGLPIKMYSLFGSDGDMDLVLGTPTRLSYDAETFDFPVLKSLGSNTNTMFTNGYCTKGSFSDFESMAMASACRTLSASYEENSNMAMGAVFSSELSTVSSLKNKLRMIVSGEALAPLKTSYLANGRLVSNDTNNPFGSPDSWGSGVLFTDKVNVVSYSKGVETERNTTTWQGSNNNLKSTAMMSSGVSTTEPSFVGTFHGYFSESWCLREIAGAECVALSNFIDSRH